MIIQNYRSIIALKRDKNIKKYKASVLGAFANWELEYNKLSPSYKSMRILGKSHRKVYKYNNLYLSQISL